MNRQLTGDSLRRMLQVGYAFATAMRSGFIVVNSPCGNRLTGLLQGFKPVLIQALITKRTIETLDVRVLRWAARLECSKGQDSREFPVICAFLSDAANSCSQKEKRPRWAFFKIGRG